jgi:hypothetical protein
MSTILANLERCQEGVLAGRLPMPISRPGKLPLVQTACRQPNTQAVVDQHLHAVAPAIGKEISAVRLRRTESRHDSCEGFLGAGAHIHRFGGQPNCVDADHEASPRTKRIHPSGSEDGHFTVMVCSPNVRGRRTHLPNPSIKVDCVRVI